MENEFYDEARKCPQCNIVTYCDRCPICGKLLPRSSASAKFAKFSGHVAGEEGELLQTREKGSIREHIEVDATTQSKNLFEYAEHSEPKIKLHGAHTKPTHPYFQEGEPNRNGSKKSVIAMVIAFSLIACVLVGVLFILRYNDTQTSTETNYSEIYMKEPMFLGNNEISGDYYRYDPYDDESIIEIENTGDRSLYGTLEFYNKDQLIGSVSDVLIMPNEICDLSAYTSKEATSYRFVDYEFYEISSTKPDYDFEVSNVYGSVALYTETEIGRKDLEILLPYLIEASSYDLYFELLDLEIYVNNKNTLSIYMYNDGKSAEVYELSDNGKIVDQYEITIGDSKSFETGAAL